MSEAVATGGAIRSKVPVHFWIVGILALLWNGYGAFDYLATVFRWEPYMSHFPQDQLDYFYGFPAWMYVIWACGTLGGLLGAVGLLLRKRWAVMMLGLSLVAAVVSMIVSFFMEEPPESLGGPAAIIFPIVIIGIALGLFYYARKMAARGILR
jgi:hypothetical protein